MYNRIYKFIECHGIISKQQFGFLKNLGTKDALSKLTSIINDKIDKSIPTIVTFLDLAKAFDSVDHDILLKKLFRYGIRGKALDIIRSYLSNRKQRVKIDKVQSQYKNITIGVPQGTILGPLLFILYVNDLLMEMPKDSVISYADDTAVIISDENWDDAMNKMNLILDYIANWLIVNKLTLNVEKTVFITFGSYCDSVPKNVTIKIHKKLIRRVESYKYLGIHIDYNLKWNRRVESIVNRTKYLVYVFYKLAKILSIKILLLIYYAYFNGIMNHSIQAWGSASISVLYPLQSLQNKLLEIISKKNFMLQNYPLRLDQIYILESLFAHYEELKEKFINSISITRIKSIQLPKCNKTLIRNSSRIVAIKYFNLLPIDLKRLSTSKKNIKSRLKIWIADNT